MRTTEEICERAKTHGDALGFNVEVLLSYVPFDAAKAAGLLKPDATGDGWDPHQPVRETLLADMAAYMVFAWEKCLDHRGISAGRSVSKMGAWLWLLEDAEALAFAGDDANYPNYGAPILSYISQRYDLAIPDDPAVERMARGETCRPGCEEGCGRYSKKA